MIALHNVTVPLSYDDAFLRRLCSKKLRLSPGEILSVRLLKKSVDARKKSDVRFCLSLGVTVSQNEEKVLARAGEGTLYREPPLCFHPPLSFTGLRPVICGAGPAGLFAALSLAKAGLKPLVLERGAAAEERVRAIEAFTKTGKLDPRTNVQFGEGGAGTFSDGKLNSNLHDEKCFTVLRVFAACGAPEEILYQAKPHLGTDKLPGIVSRIRRDIEASGGEVRFLSRLTDVCFADGRLTEVVYEDASGAHIIPANRLVLATGHSARDVFELLNRKGAAMERKPFSMGVRVEHRQEMIDRSQYGPAAGNPALGAADYKLFCHLPSGRSVYSFCMCPGGQVVAAASEEGCLVVNGMSRFARDGENANSALLVNVEPDDFGEGDVLAGLRLQETYEKIAFALGGGGYQAPAQRMEDFLAARSSTGAGSIHPSYPLGVTWCDLSPALPPFAVQALREAVPVLDRKLSGFAHPDAVLTGVETRSSSPVRILRNEQCISSLAGVYPCGEGAGYAGGIMSAAVDGLRVAKAIILEEEATK